MNFQIEQLIKDSVAALISQGVETSALEIKLLLSEILGCDVSSVLFYEHLLTPQQQKQFDEFINLRKNYAPVDKIIGQKGFYKYDFCVTADVLSPRPDTEIMVEAAIEGAKRANCSKVLELGVGSGCIILSLLAEDKKIRGVGVDISKKALDVATKNAEQLGVLERIKFVQADWFVSDFISQIGQKFDMIVSNPPYIPSSEIATLDKEVKNYDPHCALDGGPDGMTSYRRIAQIVPDMLFSGGRVYLEVGEGQAEEVALIFKNQGFTLEEIRKDLSGIKRCVILKK